MPRRPEGRSLPPNWLDSRGEEVELDSVESSIKGTDYDFDPPQWLRKIAMYLAAIIMCLLVTVVCLVVFFLGIQTALWIISW